MQTEPIQLTVYSGAKCCLCEDARDVLTPLAAELQLSVDWVMIDNVPELEAQWRERIPVGVINKRMVFKYHVDEALLRRRVAELRSSVQLQTITSPANGTEA